MSLTKKSIETLTDLIENKLASMEVFDREDARELACMEKARRELVSLAEAAQSAGKIPGKAKAAAGRGDVKAAAGRGDVIAFPVPAQKRRNAAG